jgi:hypothetical protein
MLISMFSLVTGTHPPLHSLDKWTDYICGLFDVILKKVGRDRVGLVCSGTEL